SLPQLAFATKGSLKDERNHLYICADITLGYGSISCFASEEVMTQTGTMIDTSVLDEVVHWIKTLKDIGVSPDTAANVTTKFFIAATEEEEEDEEEYYEE